MTISQAVCYSIEYKRVMASFNYQRQAEIVSLSRNIIRGKMNVIWWAEQFARIIGFKKGEINFKVTCKKNHGGMALPSRKQVLIGAVTSVHTLLHEITHILCYEDKVQYSYNRRRSVHNQGFANYLNMVYDNILEYKEELGLQILSFEAIKELEYIPMFELS